MNILNYKNFKEQNPSKLCGISNFKTNLSKKSILNDPQTMKDVLSWVTVQKMRNLNTSCNDTDLSGYQKKKKYTQSRTTGISSISTFEIQRKYTQWSCNPQRIEKNQFVKRSFYAMNFQVDFRNNRRHRLEPYECEPGMCIPGECDPYECKKRIMRRLMKTYSTMTSTGNRTHSISSETDGLHPNLNSHKNQFRQYESIHKGVHKRREIQHRTKSRSEKQAVRIGSSFDFNIEFYKDKSDRRDSSYGKSVGPDSMIQSTPSAIVRRKKSCITCRGTSCYEQPCSSKCTAVCSTGTRDRDSQSGILMNHRGSGISPKHKRCFCTLQLMKEGHQNTRQRGIKLNTKNYPRDVMLFKTTGQNTIKRGGVRKRYIKNIDPNECTPGTCAPGECDPYECLERIKARNQGLKNFGTGMKSGNASISSRTVYSPNQGKYAQHRQRDNNKYSEKPRVKRHKRKYNSITSHPSRQAVRIGSSFNFSVEFCRNSGGYQIPHRNNYVSDKDNNIPCVTCKSKTRQRRSQGSIGSVATSTRSAQSGPPYRHRSDQNSIATKHRGTASGKFLERCFCTAKLHSRNYRQDGKKSSKFRSYNINGIKKKHRKVRKHDEQSTTGKGITVVKISGDCLTQSTSVVYDKKKAQDTAVVMIGGSNMQCVHVSHGSEAEKVLNKYPDKEKEYVPKYKCAKTCTYYKLFDNKRKFLAARNAIKYSETVTQTHRRKGKHGKQLLPYECEPGVCVPGQCDPYVCLERIKKRSTHANTVPHTRKRHSRSIWTEYESRTSSSMVQSPKYKKSHRAPRHEMERHQMNNIPSSRNAVKIGSNFGFNVEFYKDKNSEFDNQHLHFKKRRKEVDAYSTGSGGTDRMKKRVKNFNTSVSSQDRLSQVEPIRKHRKKAGIGPMLKRCFCTQAFHKVGFKKKCINMASHGTHAPICKAVPIDYNQTSSYKEKPYKLKPNECEPGVCVPEQSDSNECIKRIRKRQQRNAMTDMGTRYRDRDVQLQHKKKHARNTDVQSLFDKKLRKDYSSTSKFLSDLGGRQSVRIGSNFSFSVEFYRDKNNRGTPRGRRRKKKAGTKQSQASKGVASGKCNPVDCKSQYDRHMESKGSGVGILMKRCFCTLTLQNAQGHYDNYKPKPRKTIQDSSVGTKQHYNYDSSLYKQTGTKTRKMYPTVYPLMLPSECEPGVCEPGRCNPVQCLKRIKDRMKRQAETEEFDMSMYECEPGICIPGQCNPYECLERMKRRGKLMKSLMAGCKDGCSQYQRGKHHKSQCSPVCKTKDTCLQTSCQKTESRGLEVKPLLLKRCFCTAKLLQQQAMKKRLYPAYTVGRVTMFQTMSPFMPSNVSRLQGYILDASKINVKLTASVIDSNIGERNEHKKINTTMSENLIPVVQNDESHYKLKETKTIFPYAPKKFERYESKTLLSPVKKIHIINYNNNNVESMKDPDNYSDTPNPTLNILSRQTNKVKDASTNLSENVKELLKKDNLKKSQSERKPQKQSYDPRETKSVKISKTRVSILNALCKKLSKFKYSALQSGDTLRNERSLDIGAVQSNKIDKYKLKLNNLQDSNKNVVKHLFSKINKSEFLNRLKNGHSQFYKFLIKFFKNKPSTDFADIIVQGRGLNLLHSHENVKRNSTDYSCYTGCLIDERPAGDMANHVNATGVDEIERITNQRTNVSGIKFTLKAKGAKAQVPVATFFFKAGRNNYTKMI